MSVTFLRLVISSDCSIISRSLFIPKTKKLFGRISSKLLVGSPVIHRLPFPSIRNSSGRKWPHSKKGKPYFSLAASCYPLSVRRPSSTSTLPSFFFLLLLLFFFFFFFFFFFSFLSPRQWPRVKGLVVHAQRKQSAMAPSNIPDGLCFWLEWPRESNRLDKLLPASLLVPFVNRCSLYLFAPLFLFVFPSLFFSFFFYSIFEICFEIRGIRFLIPFDKGQFS